MNKQRLSVFYTLCLGVTVLISQAFAAPGTVSNLTPETTVKLLLCDGLRSGRSKRHARVTFKVDEDICDTQGTILIRRGTPAFGTVLNSRRAGALGKRGVLDVAVDYTTSIDGQRVKLRSNRSKTGGGDKRLMTAGAILVAWPLAFCRGGNVSIKEGTIFVAYVDDNIQVNVGGVTPGVQPPVSAGQVAAPVAAIPPGMKLLQLRNGDRVTGKVLGMSNGTYEVKTSMGIVNIPEADVLEMHSGSILSKKPEKPAHLSVEERIRIMREERAKKK